MILAASTPQTLPPSSQDRVPAVRARADLVIVRQHYQGVVGWIVKNPLSLDYYRLPDEEYFLLRQLDGRRSMREIRSAFEHRFAPRTVDYGELQRYMSVLHRDGLVVSSTAGQADLLETRGASRRKQVVRERFGNILALRFRGVDPAGLFDRLYPYVRWFFSPWCAAACTLLMVTALFTLLGRFDRFCAALPNFHSFFTAENLLWLAVVGAGVKVLHELGHGLLCKHFGGECHELGFMLLCFTPTMYCNVSDSWLLPGKWRRAAIGAAGIYVELVIASWAALVWCYTEPGLVHALALDVVFVCTISTLIVNLNPLMRYDGYYILSDVLEITNLGAKANSALRNFVGRTCLGLRRDDDPLSPRHYVGLFAAYAVASFVYRWLVFFGILWFLNKFFEPYRLDFIGQALGSLAVVGLVVPPVRGLVRFLGVPGRIDLVNKSRVAVTLSVLGVIVLGLFVVPLPRRVYAPLDVQPRDAHSVYVEIPGTLVELLVKPGAEVVKDQPLARLTNIDVQLEIDRLQARRDETKVTLDSLKKERYTDDTAAARIAVAEQSLRALDELLAKRIDEARRLVLVAPESGTVLPPPPVPPAPRDDGRLPAWSGTPLEDRNLGCTLEAGTLFCRIGDPKRMEAVLLVDQADVTLVATEQAADVRLEELPGRVFHGSVREIARTDAKVAPRSLSNKAGGDVVTDTDESGQERPRSTSYQVRVSPLDDPGGLLRIGLRGECKIYVGSQTAAGQLARAFRQTFHFDW
jgi:putative peptide zinc metalloprotease protein